ncbi:hypothetical protein KC963_04670, partial [Candidatus Saccharibacteria bacterium]|nr:hypothetical protein [Candidatus Saccharibacteria bacterium]
MADLIRWFKDRKEEVRDIFDANTQADQQRRMAQGQPRLYQDQQTQRAQPVQRPAPNVQQPQA